METMEVAESEAAREAVGMEVEMVVGSMAAA